MSKPTDPDVLLTKLNVAVKAANEAETSVTTAQAELVSRSKVVGLLLLEAKKLHPKVNDFEVYAPSTVNASAAEAGRSAGDRASFGRPVSGTGAMLRIGKN
jgi:hypothetical protein